MRTRIAFLLIPLMAITSLSFTKSSVIIKANSDSKIRYALTFLKIPYKRKDLPVDAKLEITQGLISDKLKLKSINLVSDFTSKNILFRKIIDYEQYPNFSFSSTLDSPVPLLNNSSIVIPGNVSFHGVTRKVKVKFKNNSKADHIYLSGQAKINMRDFGINSPLLYIIPTDNVIKTKIELYADLN